MEKIKTRWRNNYLQEETHTINIDNNSTSNHHNHHHHKHHRHRHHHHHHHSSSSNNSSSSALLPNYEPINENIYVGKRKNDHHKNRKEARSMVCECILSKEEKARGEMGCLNDCLNRMLMIECGSKCTLGEHCLNKRFQKFQSARVEVFKTKKKGWGLRTTTTLPAGSFVMEYVGEVVRSKEFRSRVKKYTKQKIRHHYFMALQSDEIIDATCKGNLTRFINHSCEPNCETQKWTVNGELRIGFFTIKDLEPGEEITFDYQFQRYGRKAQKCYCGTPSCRGYIGGNDQTFSLNDQSSPAHEIDSDEASKDEKFQALHPGFKIPRLQRSEIERIRELANAKDLQNLQNNNNSNSNANNHTNKERTTECNTPFNRFNYFNNNINSTASKTLKTNGISNPQPIPTTNSSLNHHNPLTSTHPLKRKYDSLTANNIDSTPVPKMSKEERRQRFELNVKLKEVFDNIEKIYGPQIAEFYKLAYRACEQPPAVNGVGGATSTLGASSLSNGVPIPYPTLPHPTGAAAAAAAAAGAATTPIAPPAAAALGIAPNLWQQHHHHHLNHHLVPPSTLATPATALIGPEKLESEFKTSTRVATKHTTASTTTTSPPTLVVLANHTIHPTDTIDDDLAFSICGYDKYYSLREQPLKAEDVIKNRTTNPYPGSYYTTPDGETWFVTVTVDRKTQQPRNVVLNLHCFDL